MSTKPYLRIAEDGTYELVVPAGKGRDHILPYCFHTEQDAMDWLSTRKGREQVSKIYGHNRHRHSVEHGDLLA